MLLSFDLTVIGASGFSIDADISGNLAPRERNLKRWEASSDAPIDLSLDETNKAGWDQFEVNERLYGVKTDYDENIYTTTIDRNNPLYKQRAAAAEKIAREIEASSAMNAHVAEERGQVVPDDSGLREEEK
jgi:PAB1-binding protein PBP1